MSTLPANTWGQYQLVHDSNADPEEIRALDAQQLELRCPLDNGRHDVTAALTNPDLGTLSLPPELVWLVIKHLDIPSLTTFRRVSRRAMHMVDTTFEYQNIMNRAPQIIRGALTLEANRFTLNDAYITLSDDACTTCEKRGGYVYLITCERVCALCLIMVHRWRPHEDGDTNLFNLELLHHPRPWLPWLAPSVTVRPGTYGTAGGYYHFPYLALRAFSNKWVHKLFSTRFRDGKDCEYDRLPFSWQFAQCNRIEWLASAFFVSVSVPLEDRERHITEEDN